MPLAGKRSKEGLPMCHPKLFKDNPDQWRRVGKEFGILFTSIDNFKHPDCPRPCSKGR